MTLSPRRPVRIAQSTATLSYSRSSDPTGGLHSLEDTKLCELSIDDQLARIFDEEARHNVIELTPEVRDAAVIRERVRAACQMRGLGVSQTADCITDALDALNLGHSRAYSIGVGTKRAENISRRYRVPVGPKDAA